MDLHVEQSGDGPGIVLAHGFAGSARNFRPQVRALRDRWRVVVYDAPGHARSAAAVPAEARAFGMAGLVAAFDEAARAAGPGPIVAGGLSLGAATALGFALEHPERVRALVLASFPAGGGAAGSLSARALAFADAIEREGTEAAGARFVWGPESGLDAAGARLVRQGFLEHPGPALAAILRGAVHELPSIAEWAERAAALDVPALVVSGAADRASLEAGRRLAEAWPAARHVEIPGAGHVVNLARPDAFDAALLAFLDEVAA